VYHFQLKLSSFQYLLVHTSPDAHLDALSLLQLLVLQPSVPQSEKCNCFDNAVIESFHSSLKSEEFSTHPRVHFTNSIVLEKVETYMYYYNYKRPFKKLNCHTPVELRSIAVYVFFLVSFSRSVQGFIAKFFYLLYHWFQKILVTFLNFHFLGFITILIIPLNNSSKFIDTNNSSFSNRNLYFKHNFIRIIRYRNIHVHDL
jgi:hypothetical protein